MKPPVCGGAARLRGWRAMSGESIDLGVGDSVVTAWRLRRADAAFIDPMLQRRIADAEALGGGANGEKSHIDPF